MIIKAAIFAEFWNSWRCQCPFFLPKGTSFLLKGTSFLKNNFFITAIKAETPILITWPMIILDMASSLSSSSEEATNEALTVDEYSLNLPW